MKILLLFCWMICTIILTCTLIGMFLFIPHYGDYVGDKPTPSTWMQIGKNLLNGINSNY
jgi:hypothetical protein